MRREMPEGECAERIGCDVRQVAQRIKMSDCAPSQPSDCNESAPASFAAARVSESWSKAEIHFEMAKAAMKLAARNTEGAQMAAEHLERAAKTLREKE